MRLLPYRSWLLVCVLAALTCGREEAPEAAANPQRAAPDDVAPAAARADPPRRREFPLPAFSGRTLEGERVDASSFVGKRLLLFFFNPEVPEARPVADAVAAISKLRGPHNFEILGVGVGAKRQTLETFVAEHGFDFRVIDDSDAAITRRLQLRVPIRILGVDAEGYVAFLHDHFPTDPSGAEGMIRGALRLPASGDGTAPVLGNRPPAPNFRAPVLDGDEPFELSAQAGRPVVLIFFLHTCPHCHDALAFLKKTLAAFPEDKRPALAGVEITGRTQAVRRELKNRGFDFFPVLFDDDGSIRAAYGVFAGVPDIVLIDAGGFIAARIPPGWREERDPPLIRMRLAQLAGAPVPMLLRSKGYSGNETCGVCHALEYETWMLTSHASAFDTLVRHGSERDAECVSCHVVGHGQPGGYVDPLQTPELENVGCESCHGRGGPHLLPGAAADESYASACAPCHDAKHSLGFDYATFLPRVSHAANAHLAALPLEEKQKLLAERGRPRDNLLPTSAAYVGSEACQSCHEAEYATWASGPHAGALESLERAEQAGNAECLKCHTTGFGRPGGFPAAGSPAPSPDLGRVGCESCHGPAGEHVKEGAVKIGSIVSLGDKCDSCVILQICGSCHDEANDPGFEFEVLEKIEKQRHGTIEPGTGRPKGKSAQRLAPHPSDAALLARIFAELEPGS